MHICFLCNEYPPSQHGGVGSFVQTLGRELVARGHRITVVGFSPAESRRVENDQGVRVFRLAHSPVPNTGLAVNGSRLRRALMQLHREQPIDVLEGPELSLALLPRSFPPAKVIRMNGGHHFFAVTLGGRPQLWRSWLELRSFKRADYLCAVSRFVADTTRKLLGLDGRPIEILPNPVDLALFSPGPEVPEESGLVLFVGTVCEKKGIRQLIQAMPKIVAAVPEAHLWVVGRDWRDPATRHCFTDQLRTLIPATMRERIIFKGPIPHSLLPDVIAKASVCVYPSHMEALPIAWLEGLAMGKAVVASSAGPGPELVEEGVSGLLCDPHDPLAIAEKVIQLLREPMLRRQLGGRAREQVVRQFSVDVLAGRNEAFYQHCLQHHQGR